MNNENGIFFLKISSADICYVTKNSLNASLYLATKEKLNDFQKKNKKEDE